jgi:hypothetical protein
VGRWGHVWVLLVLLGVVERVPRRRKEAGRGRTTGWHHHHAWWHSRGRRLRMEGMRREGSTGATGASWQA